jgi:hypothetical protein
MSPESGNQTPFNDHPYPPIPTEYISAAMKHIAVNMGGEQLHKTVITLIETSDPELPSASAINFLAKGHPNAVEYILTLSEEMYADSILRETKQGRRIARREERPEWRRALGWSILRAVSKGSSWSIPPHDS